jgi:hypothetical protein
VTYIDIDHDSYTPKVDSNYDENCIRRIAVYADEVSIQYFMEIAISGIFSQLFFDTRHDYPSQSFNKELPLCSGVDYRGIREHRFS